MSKKHYEAIAASIRTQIEMANVYQNASKGGEVDERAVYARVTAVKLAMRSLANDLADKFQDDNGLFQRSRFLKACGI